MITVCNLTKYYGNTRALSAVNAQFASGETVCIMAPSGAGKTTLARLLTGLEKPDAGCVEGAHGARFAYLFQEDRLAPQLTAPANVRLACGRLAEAQLDAAFAAVGLVAEDLAKPTAQLSGGQARRVALVRTMLAQADAVVLDEPFKGLDEKTRARAAAFVKAQQRGRTLLCITHDVKDAALLAARLLPLDSVQAGSN